jgi:lipoate-protein ligase A
MRVRVTRPAGPAVVLGRSGDAGTELHLDAVRRDGVPVLRRRGGGCAVLLDPGNLVIAAVLRAPGLAGIHPHFRAMARWIGEALAELGVPRVEQRGISDLALGERKIGGSCIFRAKDLLYYSTTLLVEPDIDRMERYLRHPPREPDYRRGRSHREFVTCLGRPPWGLETGTLAVALDRRLTPARWAPHSP